MINRIRLSLACFLFVIASTLAQEKAAVIKAEKAPAKPAKCRVVSLPEGALIVFDEIEADPKEAEEKRKTEPIHILKEYKVSAADNSLVETKDYEVKATEVSSFSDLKFTISIGEGKEMTSTNGECDLPTEITDGSYAVTVSWNWKTAVAKTPNPKFTANFHVEVTDGNYVSINAKPLRMKAPVKKVAAKK